MASKGQKFRRYTDEERTEIVTKYLSKKYHTYVKLANEYGNLWYSEDILKRGKIKEQLSHNNLELSFSFCMSCPPMT